ncbi:glycosyltransferase 87 family protein [Rhodococcus sp. NPDC058505]|uniref:glycosyltransferase 87 family protein n=1 Tax=Rhodococcus sp. NPDC058505 TaxID=3346531 RepID=UPI00364752CF
MRSSSRSVVDDRTLSWPVLAGAAVVAVGVVIWHLVAVPIGNPFYGLFVNYADLAIYRAGGDAIVHRTGLYDGPILFGMQFTYTPFAALVFAPFALIGQSLTNVIWWVATFVALVAIVALSLKSLRYRLTPRVWVFSALLAVVTTAFEPVRTTIWLGQINVFLVLLVVWDLTRADGSRLKGLGVGIAAGIKLTPAFFLAYLALTRQWRTGVTALSVFAATVALGFAIVPADAWSYWTHRITQAQRVGPVDAPSNQSVNGFFSQLLRFYDITRYRDPDTGVFAAPTWMWLLGAAVAAAVGLSAAVLAHRRGQELLAVTLTGMTSAAVSPFSWGHHWVWFVPLLVLALHYALTATARLRWLVPTALLIPAFAWWWNYPDGPPLHGADHPIGIGLFMLPRDDAGWSAQILVPIYAGCYPLVLAITAAGTVWCLRGGDADRRDLPAMPEPAVVRAVPPPTQVVR